MAKMLGYMLTWTTYGTWLQGDKRGWVKDGEVLGANERLEASNRQGQKWESVRLNGEEKTRVQEAIIQEAARIRQEIYALAVCSNHVHIVVACVGESIGKIAGRYKRAGTATLRPQGRDGRLWTTGYDKRYCFDEKAMKDRIAYVERHNE